MNLLHDPWMPVRDSAGQRHWITPDRLAEPQWRAFDADRPDFNGALAQFAIGLLQTTTPVANVIEWGRLHKSPPDSATLRQWFEPVAAAFVLDGDGARFMQDLSLQSEDGKSSPIAEILIDAPGESGVDGNKDLFVKRGVVLTVCPACAAAATLTLQINAPEGGRGHYTGMRGGGPLTTLVSKAGEATLWSNLWLNVIDGYNKPSSADEPQLELSQSTFPWLGTVEQFQPQGGSITSAQANAVHAFWSMPRRVRLDFQTTTAPQACSICDRPSTQRVRTFRSRPNGIDYPSNAWLHPLTPYREKDGSWLPVRPKGDGLGYRHWLAWAMSLGHAAERRAAVVDHALTYRHLQTRGALSLWTFGYEMRKDNPICWHESTIPLYALADCSPDQQALVHSEVARWLAASELVAFYLRAAVKGAWFSNKSPGDYGHIDASYYGATEPAFYKQLQSLIDTVTAKAEHPALPAREAWHAVLTRTALRLFDDNFVGTGAVERQNPRRAALAHRQLRNSLYGPKLRLALGLPVDATASKPARKSAKRATKEAA